MWFELNYSSKTMKHQNSVTYYFFFKEKCYYSNKLHVILIDVFRLKWGQNTTQMFLVHK